MADTYPQPRPAKNSDHPYTAEGIAVAATIPAFLAGVALTDKGITSNKIAEQKAKDRFGRYVSELDKERVKKSIKPDIVVK